MNRYGYSIFCDDVRNEVGGKLSFIGCYNAVMFLPPPLPCVLPKFCIHFHIVSPADRPYRRIVVRCYIPGDPQPVAEDIIEAPPAEHQATLVSELGPPQDAPRYIVAAASLIMTSFQIDEPGLIRVRALVDDDPEELALGSLRVLPAEGDPG